MKVLLVSTGAANNAPTTATQGIPLRGPQCTQDNSFSDHDTLLVTVHNSAGTGALAVTVRIWVYSYDVAKWFPMGQINKSATAAAIGSINAGNSIPAVATDTLAYSEYIQGFRQVDRVYAEIISPAGTTPVFDVNLVLRMSETW